LNARLSWRNTRKDREGSRDWKCQEEGWEWMVDRVH
jgi:hypothetical protein